MIGPLCEITDLYILHILYILPVPAVLQGTLSRARQPLPLHLYTGLLAYLAYALYPPLYVAGPILSFNSFTSQLMLPVCNSARQVWSLFPFYSNAAGVRPACIISLVWNSACQVGPVF